MISDPLPRPAAAPAAPPTAAEISKRKQITETAEKFEAAFLSTMLQSMFSGVDAGAFGGGEGERAFKSFMTDAIAKQTSKAGGLGISAQISREMLKLQGLT